MKSLGKLLIVATIFFFGCVGSIKVKEMKQPESSAGLDTIPYYYPGHAQFDTNEAIQFSKADEAKEKRFKENIVKKVKASVEKSLAEEGAVEIPGGAEKFDPWIPPDTRSASDLPPALRGFPKDFFGYPDWTGAVSRGYILPRDAILDKDKEKGESGDSFDKDILFIINDPLMANVLFPHKTHTFWLACNNCHPSIFVPVKGGNEFSMYDVWNGEYCGKCHGKVAFQPKGFENCQRCHSQKKRGGGGF